MFFVCKTALQNLSFKSGNAVHKSSRVSAFYPDPAEQIRICITSPWFLEDQPEREIFSRSEAGLEVVVPVNLDEELAVRGQQVEVNLQDTAQV